MRREPHVRFCERAAVQLHRATHLVVGFQHRREAERFLDELTQRLADFALLLNLDKTRLIEFGRHAPTNHKGRGLGKPEVFDFFLGFAHNCGRSWKGRFLLRRQSRRDRLRAKLREIRETLWQHRHAPIEEQGSWLRHVATWFAYHVVPVNGPLLRIFWDGVIWPWRRALWRRGQRDQTSWTVMTALANRCLPRPRILHPWPSQRFAVTHPRWEPYALIGPVRFCAGGGAQ